MKKRNLAYAIISIILVLLMLSACSKKNSEVSSNKQVDSTKFGVFDGIGGTTGSNLEKVTQKNTVVSNSLEKTSISKTIDNAILSQRKIIRNANLKIEVENFSDSYNKIKFAISNNGYIQETNISKEKVYLDLKENLITKGTIIVRVDKNKFDEILNGFRGLGVVLDESIKSDDVTDKFFDIESRLRLLKFEEGRLEQYLQKITDPDVIFKTESRLTDIRHEIEGLTGNLNKLSSLVELSTITINLEEKVGTSQDSYWRKLGNSFVGSFSDVGIFFANLLMFIASLIPFIIILIIFVILMRFIYRKYKKIIVKKSKKKEDEFDKQDEIHKEDKNLD